MDDVAGPLLGRGGNVEMSRPGSADSHVLVSLPGQFAGLEQDHQRLAAQVYKVTTTPDRPTPARPARLDPLPHRSPRGRP